MIEKKRILDNKYTFFNNVNESHKDKEYEIKIEFI